MAFESRFLFVILMLKAPWTTLTNKVDPGVNYVVFCRFLDSLWAVKPHRVCVLVCRSVYSSVNDIIPRRKSRWNSLEGVLLLMKAMGVNKVRHSLTSSQHGQMHVPV